MNIACVFKEGRPVAVPYFEKLLAESRPLIKHNNSHRIDQQNDVFYLKRTPCCKARINLYRKALFNTHSFTV